MILIRETQEPTGDPPLLQDVEERDSFRHRQSEIEVVVYHEMRCRPVVDVIDRVPALKVVSVIPNGAVQLFIHGQLHIRVNRK